MRVLTTEIKIQYEDVEKAIATMNTAIQSFNTAFPAYVGGQNEMDSMVKINELNDACHKLMEAYKELLMINAAAAQESANQMKEADETVSQSIAAGR
ncbi:YwqI/YxiC family protein [Metabacillus sp. 84]|uniref:YwqI/YxiC family protein n=1 Tax=Metabacillus sp. 84 TaxID=3404705 RepID=UPI003CEB3C2B